MKALFVIMKIYLKNVGKNRKFFEKNIEKFENIAENIDPKIWYNIRVRIYSKKLLINTYQQLSQRKNNTLNSLPRRVDGKLLVNLS